MVTWESQRMWVLHHLIKKRNPSDKSKVSEICCNFVIHLIIRDKIMARPIAETPVLTGEDAIRFENGEHNFTISTLAMLSSFFGQPIITVG